MKSLFFRSMTVMLLASLILLPLQAVKAEAAEPLPLEMYFPADIEEHWAFDELDNFVNADLLRGYQDAEGNVWIKPNNSISRAEFVAILVRVLGLTSDAAGKTFADVEAGKWYADPIRVASSLGIVNGISDTKFGPNVLITRGEIATMVVRAFESSVTFEGEIKEFSDVPDYFAKPSIEKASQVGIVRGATATEFKPFDNAKRAEAVVMLQRALDLQKQALPEDAALTAVISEAEAKEFQIFEDKTYEQFHDAHDKYYTGYYLSTSYSLTEQLLEMIDEGVSIDMEKVSDQTLTVLDKTDRFAIVESAGGSYTTTTTIDNDTTTETIHSDGIYYLKKMEDGSWKVYMYYSVEE